MHFVGQNIGWTYFTTTQSINNQFMFLLHEARVKSSCSSSEWAVTKAESFSKKPILSLFVLHFHICGIKGSRFLVEPTMSSWNLDPIWQPKPLQLHLIWAEANVYGVTTMIADVYGSDPLAAGLMFRTVDRGHLLSQQEGWTFTRNTNMFGLFNSLAVSFPSAMGER